MLFSNSLQFSFLSYAAPVNTSYIQNCILSIKIIIHVENYYGKLLQSTVISVCHGEFTLRYQF